MPCSSIRVHAIRVIPQNPTSSWNKDETSPDIVFVGYCTDPIPVTNILVMEEIWHHLKSLKS